MKTGTFWRITQNMSTNVNMSLTANPSESMSVNKSNRERDFVGKFDFQKCISLENQLF